MKMTHPMLVLPALFGRGGFGHGVDEGEALAVMGQVAEKFAACVLRGSRARLDDVYGHLPACMTDVL